ncbi:MAG TPA: hypothetical protein VFG53_17090 [Anaeromyxobacter sp.]|nr:hypothetical protein [Anaeromyxobacter sp.]
MTLEQLVVDGGLVTIMGLGAVLAFMWPRRSNRIVLCLKTRREASCPKECLPACREESERTVELRPRHASGSG